jgi:hypothetical protein
LLGRTQGLGSAGDYLVSAQSSEQALVIHRFGKTQPVFKVRAGGGLKMRLPIASNTS